MSEIIINGIDVSEEHKNCKYRFKGKSCEDCPLNCRLKRLQEENKAYQLSENEAKEIIAELEHKNKNLEKELKTYKCQEKFPNQCHCAFRCLGNEFCQDADERINKYKQALEETRNIAKEFLKDLCDDCAWYNTDECNPEGYNCGEMNKIISKIREVLK